MASLSGVEERRNDGQIEKHWARKGGEGNAVENKGDTELWRTRVGGGGSKERKKDRAVHRTKRERAYGIRRERTEAAADTPWQRGVSETVRKG